VVQVGDTMRGIALSREKIAVHVWNVATAGFLQAGGCGTRIVDLLATRLAGI
jgi:hypothetical protein